MLPDCKQGNKLKITYRSPAKAKQAAKKARSKGHMYPIRIYSCNNCNGYHITSQPYMPYKKAS